MDQSCEVQSIADAIQQDVQEKRYVGIGRLAYFGGMLGLSVLQGVCGAATEGGCGVAFLGYIVVIPLALALVVSRLRNIGMNGWWSLLALVPIAGCYVLIKCLVCPEGYEDSKKLDGTGKAIAGVCITLILLVVVALVLSVGNGARSPSTCGAAMKEDWSQSKPVEEPQQPPRLVRSDQIPDTPTGPVPLDQIPDTPSSRLAGRWRNVDYGNEVIYSPVDQLGTGTYRLCKPSEGTGPAFRFKVISEDTSGTALVIRDFRESDPAIIELSVRLRMDFSKSDILCNISKDGRQMTQEYTDHFGRTLCVYQKVD